MNTKVFVKIDIEGAEYELFDSLLDQLSKINAVFLVSVHPWLIHKNSKRVLQEDLSKH